MEIENETLFQIIEKNMDLVVDEKIHWTLPVSDFDIQNAKSGILQLKLTKNKFVPRDWLPTNLDGVKILCLAGAGGRQAVLLAAAGASVTIFDISEKMIDIDKNLAKAHNLDIRYEQGNMCDLSRFDSNTYDIIVNPVSMIYVPNTKPVFNECYRVLKKNGALIMGAINPILYACEKNEEGLNYISNSIPYKFMKYPYGTREQENSVNWIEFAHSMQDLISNQLEEGFSITGFYEDTGSDQIGNFINTYFAVKSVK